MRYAVPMLLAAAVATAGCHGDDGRVAERYVAIGDSYTAGAPAGPPVGPADGCGQVTDNYPRLVAKELHARLTDASCGGAQSANGTQEQLVGTGLHWPPQLDALSEKTGLVTVGLGFNDLGFFGTLTFGCASVATTAPTGAPCRDTYLGPGTDFGTRADRIGDLLRDLLRQVKERAPHAEVLLVGYPRLVPDEGTCPALPLAAGDYAFVRDQLDHLDDAMRHAAADAGATFVDVHGASKGHDICAGDDAWVNGATPTTGATEYHPFARGQRAVADLVLAALQR